MKSVDLTIISIGALSQNLLWQETTPQRPSHATISLIRHDERVILVDPSLPAELLEAKFNERTGKTLADVTDVFCTTLRPVHRRGLNALSHAAWWCSETEIQAYSQHLEELAGSAQRLSSDDEATIAADIQLLRNFRAAPEKFTDQVHLFPLVGASVGSAGLLLTPATKTILIAGDAVPTKGHLLKGQVWSKCTDTEAAMECLSEVLQIADIIIPGHDNIILAVS